jgi:hypothetical protein
MLLAALEEYNCITQMTPKFEWLTYYLRQPFSLLGLFSGAWMSSTLSVSQSNMAWRETGCHFSRNAKSKSRNNCKTKPTKLLPVRILDFWVTYRLNNKKNWRYNNKIRRLNIHLDAPSKLIFILAHVISHRLPGNR